VAKALTAAEKAAANAQKAAVAEALAAAEKRLADATTAAEKARDAAAAAAAATAAATAAAAAAAAAAPVPFDAAEHFKGKTIRLVANSNPGGGTDSQGRVMASFISKWIPGNPRVVFTNSPNKPQEYVFAATKAPKDGTYISWNSTPQLNFGFDASTDKIKRSTFEFIGATIDGTRSWVTYKPEENLGPGAGDKCFWDFANMSNTGGGKHGMFLQADEISDIRDGDTTVIGNILAMEYLGIPFDYYGFDTVDTNAVRTMWAQGVINSTTRSSLWYRFPNENPDWIPDGTIRLMAGFGPGQMKANTQSEPHCGDVRDHFTAEQTATFNQVMGPSNFMSKALWLPPGTPHEIADAIADAFDEAFANDTALVQKYGAIAGEVPIFTTRAAGTPTVLENEKLYEAGIVTVERENARILQKYFPQYIGG